jgi:hypothetical protein
MLWIIREVEEGNLLRNHHLTIVNVRGEGGGGGGRRGKEGEREREGRERKRTRREISDHSFIYLFINSFNGNIFQHDYIAPNKMRGLLVKYKQLSRKHPHSVLTTGKRGSCLVK